MSTMRHAGTPGRVRGVRRGDCHASVDRFCVEFRDGCRDRFRVPFRDQFRFPAGGPGPADRPSLPFGCVSEIHQEAL